MFGVEGSLMFIRCWDVCGVFVDFGRGILVWVLIGIVWLVVEVDVILVCFELCLGGGEVDCLCGLY